MGPCRRWHRRPVPTLLVSAYPLSFLHPFSPLLRLEFSESLISFPLSSLFLFSIFRWTSGRILLEGGLRVASPPGWTLLLKAGSGCLFSHQRDRTFLSSPFFVSLSLDVGRDSP